MANHISSKYTEKKHQQAQQRNLRGWYLRNVRFPRSYFNTTVQLYEKQVAELRTENDGLATQLAKKDNFVGNLAHDIKSPMNAILGFSALLSEDYDTLNEPERRKSAGAIHKSAQTLMRLIEEMLMWSRLRQGTVKVSLVAVDVSEIAKEVCEIHALAADKKGVKLINRVPFGKFVLADRGMLQQILTNLVSNSIKFCMEGGRIDIVALQGSEISIVVMDNGVGISQENIAKLMDPNLLFTLPGTANEKGTGLGMKRIIEMVKMQNGELKISSEGEGKGTKVIVSLPSAQKDGSTSSI